MISSELTEEQLVKEIRRVNKNLSRRLDRIEKRGLEVSTFALNKYKDFKEKLPIGRELRKLDKKQLQSLYRDVKYISNLKSSTVKGALATKNKFEPIRDRLNNPDDIVYLNRHNNKYNKNEYKDNVSVPSWLNEKAEIVPPSLEEKEEMETILNSLN